MGNHEKSWKMVGKSWESHGEIMGKSWETHGKIMRKSWENHEKSWQRWEQTYVFFLPPVGVAWGGTLNSEAKKKHLSLSPSPDPRV